MLSSASGNSACVKKLRQKRCLDHYLSGMKDQSTNTQPPSSQFKARFTLFLFTHKHTYTLNSTQLCNQTHTQPPSNLLDKFYLNFFFISTQSNKKKMKFLAILLAAPALFSVVLAAPTNPPDIIKIGPGSYKLPSKEPPSIGTLTVTGRDAPEADEE